MAPWKIAARLVLLGGAAMALELASAAGTAPGLEGAWAGDRLQLVIDATGGRVTSDCATGTFAGPVSLNEAGAFSALGAFDAHRPGPERADHPALPARARYVGEVSGDLMKLSIFTDGAAAAEVFNLRKGARFKPIRCL